MVKAEKEKEEVGTTPREAQEAKRDEVDKAFDALRTKLEKLAESINLDDYNTGLEVLAKAQSWFNR